MPPSKTHGKAEVKVDFSRLNFNKQLHTKQQLWNTVNGQESRAGALHIPEGLWIIELHQCSWSVQLLQSLTPNAWVRKTELRAWKSAKSPTVSLPCVALAAARDLTPTLTLSAERRRSLRLKFWMSKLSDLWITLNNWINMIIYLKTRLQLSVNFPFF